MGVEYWIVDTNQKVFYDLGKGGWYELNHEKEAFADLEYLTLFILEDCFDGYEKYRDAADAKEFAEYITNRVAPDLFATFGKIKPEHIQIVNDCGDDWIIMKSKKYKCIGTRFYDIGSQEHLEEIEHNNKHLVDNEINQRWYNPEHLTKYQEWALY